LRSLALKYRPRTFRDVVGQEFTVEVLRGLVRHNRDTRHILLHGSIGSGKTTLARIYAMALNCSALTPDCSPCLECAGCKETANGDAWRFEELPAPAFADAAYFDRTIEQLSRMPPNKEVRRIVFVDEAHSISRFATSFDTLLKVVEDAPETLAFVFATTEPDRISPALRSRTLPLVVRPLSFDDSVVLLRRVAIQEVIEVEDEALPLLWSLGRGQPRDMLNALDTVGLTGVVSRDRVLAHFDASDVGQLIDYVGALGGGGFVEASRRLFQWNASIQKKAAWIRSLFLFMYYNDLLGVSVIVDPIISSTKPAERAPILAAFGKRVPDHKDLLRVWEVMLDHFPANPAELTDEGLLLALTLFQRMACSDELLSAKFLQKPALRAPLEPLSQMSSSPRQTRPVRAHRKSQADDKNPEYLSYDEARKIFNYSSALVQATGRQFNVRISLYHEVFGIRDVNAASKNAANFVAALKSRFEARYGVADRILVQEHDAKRGFVGRIALHLSESDGEGVKTFLKWIRHWRLNQRDTGKAASAIDFDVHPIQATMSGHWKCVRWLCAGLNPMVQEFGSLELQPRTAGDCRPRNRIGFGDSVRLDLDELVRSLKLPFLSAFDSKSWSTLYTGWEIEAYALRARLLTVPPEEMTDAVSAVKPELIELGSKLGLAEWHPA
jgi:DNA polymerase-3 subunit gamma/tau